MCLCVCVCLLEYIVCCFGGAANLTIWTINTYNRGTAYCISSVCAHTWTQSKENLTHTMHVHVHTCIQASTEHKCLCMERHRQALCFTEELNLSEQSKLTSEPIRARQINTEIHICRIKPQPWLSNLSGWICLLWFCAVLSTVTVFSISVKYLGDSHMKLQSHNYKQIGKTS